MESLLLLSGLAEKALKGGRSDAGDTAVLALAGSAREECAGKL
jgi:hypothetical protein